VRQAQFVACHHFDFLDRYDVTAYAAPGATLLLNAPFPAAEVWSKLPRETQQDILDKGLRVYAIDAVQVARDAGLGSRINTVMQTCFFALSGVLPAEQAIALIKKAIEKTYDKKGGDLVQRNFAAVDATLTRLLPVPLGDAVDATRGRPPLVAVAAPDFVQRVTATMLAGKGDLLPVSAFPPDGTWPLATARWEKRNIAEEIPSWDSALCIQCNQCAFVCPHAAIRAKVYEPSALAGAPAEFQTTAYRAPDFSGLAYTLQVAAEDCTGCRLCVEICPAKERTNPRHKAIDMVPQRPLRERERRNFDFFLTLPEVDRSRIERLDAKGSQLLEPLFEFSGACAGCGETPYVKLLTQLFGDRADQEDDREDLRQERRRPGAAQLRRRRRHPQPSSAGAARRRRRRQPRPAAAGRRRSAAGGQRPRPAAYPGWTSRTAAVTSPLPGGGEHWTRT
jgi:pyruvate-ferredoxin/flavodoxin oxidoreductase